MPSSSSDDFSYLWDDSETGWVLWPLRADEELNCATTTIFNRETKMAVVIEDDDLADLVIRQMALRGVEVITEYPRE